MVGLSVQLPQVGGAQTNILGVGAQTGVVAIQGQNVTSTAQSGTVPQQQALPQQHAPHSLQPVNICSDNHLISLY